MNANLVVLLRSVAVSHTPISVTYGVGKILSGRSALLNALEEFFVGLAWLCVGLARARLVLGVLGGVCGGGGGAIPAEDEEDAPADDAPSAALLAMEPTPPALNVPCP